MCAEDDVDLIVALAIRRIRQLGIDYDEAGVIVPNELAALTDGELDAYIEQLRGSTS